MARHLCQPSRAREWWLGCSVLADEGSRPRFCFTYGDGVADVNIAKLIAFHKKQGTLAPVSAVHPPGRFGALNMEKQKIVSFEEKPDGDHSRVNGGLFCQLDVCIQIEK